MGNCFNCGRSITLKEGEGNCPNCGKDPYECWKCNTSISGEEQECSVCHFFICPTCGSCGRHCELPDIEKEVEGKNITEIIRFCFNYKTGMARRMCPKNIPISYAKVKLRNFYLKMKGVRAKTKEDAGAFEKKMQVILDYPEGFKWTISNVKEDGTYGYEFREASNFAVCLGEAKCEKVVEEKPTGAFYKRGKNKGFPIINKFEFWRYTRINEPACNFLNANKLMQRYCPQCKKNIDSEICLECNVKTKEKASHCDICNLERGLFKLKGEVDGKIFGGHESQTC